MLTVISLLLSLQELPQAAGELNPRMFWIEWVKHPVGRLIRGAMTMILSSALAALIFEMSLSAALSLACGRSRSENLFTSQFFKKSFGWTLFTAEKRALCLLMLTCYTGMVSTLRRQSKLMREDTAGVGFAINLSLTNDSQQIPDFLPCKLTNSPVFHPIIYSNSGLLDASFCVAMSKTKHSGCPALGHADVSVPCCRWHLLCWCLSRVFSPRVSPAREVEEAELTVQPLPDFPLTHDYIFTCHSGLWMLEAASDY